jgi:hypothetical protein
MVSNRGLDRDAGRGTEGVSARDFLIATAIFLVALVVFWFSPVHQLTDSNYSMLLSESLLKHRTFALDEYKIPRLAPRYHDNTFKNGGIYQIELVGPHLYYYMPPGASVLSLPYVALLNALGVSAANADGTYNDVGEETIETSLAAILMAILASLFFFTARLLLPLSWSVIIALAAALATPVWSTASRALWSDTWALLLLGLVVWMLVAHETNRRRLNTIVLASLLAWAYFVRPTNVISIVVISLFLWLVDRKHRDYFVRYALTGAVWFAGFVGYSWYNFHKFLPNYFLANRLSFGSFATAFAGNLVSPSRGLFIFVPVLAFIFYLLIIHRKRLPFPNLVLAGLAIAVLHLVVIAGFTPWNGGFAYGPRYTTGLVPWFVLLAISGVKAMRSSRAASVTFNRKRSVAWKAQLGAGALLLLVSVVLQARGAVSLDTWFWNKWPTNVDIVPGKVWDCRQPQFMAGLIPPPPPQAEVLPAGRLNFASAEADKYLWYGWSGSEPLGRWSEGKEAAIVFALNPTEESFLQIQMAPFLVADKLTEQTIEIICNGSPVERFAVNEAASRVHALRLPKDLLKDRNVLTFRFANAASPKAFGLSSDPRRLAINVEWLQLQRYQDPR